MLFRPGDTVVGGEIDKTKTYAEKDFNRTIVMDEREQSRVHEFMREMNPLQKTLVFCATQEHAALVRDFINEIKPVNDIDYCVRVTANDGAAGETDLRTFQDNEKTIPTILTTSRKLSTGVDARNIRNIVLMRPVTSMIEFKQIVGRGTRMFEGKDHFTVYDFVKAYEHFNDPEWDGEPLEPVKKPEKPKKPPVIEEPEPDPDDDFIPKLEKVVVKLADGSSRRIQYIGVTTYWLDGKQVTGEQMMKHLFGDLKHLISGEEELREKWSDPELRQALLGQLRERGFDAERLGDMARLIDAPNSDVFDILANVRFSLDPRTRQEQAEDARAFGLSGYELPMQDFLQAVLRAYEREGVDELGYDKLGDLLKIRYGSLADAKSTPGELTNIKTAFAGVQRVMYAT